MASSMPSLNFGIRCPAANVRSSMVARAVAAPSRVKYSEVKSAIPELLLDGRLVEQSSINFQEYTQATQMLNRLKGQASDLELMLHELNALEATLDDNLLATPPRDDPGDLAARKAKRAAKRAERRAKATTAAVSGRADAQVVDAAPATRTAAGPASTSGRSVLDSFSSPSAVASSSASNVQHLEELFKLTVGEPELPVTGPQSPAAQSTGPAVLRPRKASKRIATAAPAVPAAPPAAPEPASVPAPVSSPDVQPMAAAPAAEALQQAPEAGLALPSALQLPAPTRRTASRPASAAAPASTPTPAAPPASAPKPTPAPAPAPAPAAASTPAPESIAQSLERLLGGRASPHDDLAFDAHAEPSADDLHALEREVAALGAFMDDADSDADAEAEARSGAEDELADVPGGVRETQAQLEASALVPRAPAQVAHMPAGPSLLSLVPASAAQGRSARSRQARRSARSAHSGSPTGRAGGAGSALAEEPRSRGASGTSRFLAKSATVAILTPEMEREVTEMCRDYVFLDKLMRQCEKTLHRMPTTEELAAAVGMDVPSYKLRHEAGLKAKELLLKSNYRLVMSVCKKFMVAGTQMHLQDLMSEGVKGLLRATESYDGSKGFRFGTYAHWWIRQAVSRSLAETGRVIRLPGHTIEQLTKLKGIVAQLASDLGREPDIKEMAKAMGMTPARVQTLLDSARAAVSMDTPIGGSDGTQTVKDTVKDSGPDADESYGSTSMRADVEAILAELPEREARVLRLRFGLEDGTEWTLEDIGGQLGVTRERIRQMEAKAVRLLQVKAEGQTKLLDYSANLDMLEGTKELAARVSNGTKKT